MAGKRKKALWTQAFPARVDMRKVRKETIRQREYTLAREWYLGLNPHCEACSQPAIDIHHKSGRAGALLTDTARFMSVCRKCHSWIHANPEAARAKGWLCKKGEWNVVFPCDNKDSV